MGHLDSFGSLILSNGKSVHIEGILLPLGRADRAPEIYRRRTLQYLASITRGRSLFVGGKPFTLDRYGRVRAQIFVNKGQGQTIWLQQDLLTRGLARVSIAPDRIECWQELYNFESQARSRRAGIWSQPAYAARTPDTISTLDVGTFKIVQGMVKHVGMKSKRAYLDFGNDWMTDFTATISSEDMKSFRTDSVDPEIYEGQVVMLRGYVRNHDGPEIQIAVPQDIQMPSVADQK